MKLFTLITLLLSVSKSYGQSAQLGLSPTTEVLAQSEAVITNAQGSESLYYNPSLLAWQGLRLSLVGVEAYADRNSIELAKKFENKKFGEESLADFLEELSTIPEAKLRIAARLIDLSLPYFAFSSFSNLDLRYTKDNNAYQTQIRHRLGGITGFAFSFDKFAIGLSHYRFVQSGVLLDMTADELNESITAAQEGREDEITYQDFSETEFGYAEGLNSGAFYRFWDDNPSGIGISVLNIGGTEFSETSGIHIPEAKEAEKKLDDFQEKHQLSPSLPTTIPEYVNAGLNLGVGNDRSPFHARVAFEAHDLGGNGLRHRESASFSLGVELPSKLAMLSAIPLIVTDETTFHGGFLGLKVFGGARTEEQYSTGSTLSFHFGQDMIISYLRLDITAFQSINLNPKDSFPELQGARALLSATLIL